MSEFVFPSATHSRFAHSIGVFYSARRLMERIRRELDASPGAFEKKRGEAAVLAALLHDIGHGPFSHVFERARKAIAERRGQDKSKINKIKKHEDFSADMIRNERTTRDGDIRDILKKWNFDPEEIAKIVSEEHPADMYHAVVSGTFDADRMDYMRRDKYMTGIGEGGFDTNWIMDNVRVARQNGDYTLCLALKALTAAEEFLLGRYHLHKDIYHHKTTRGMECLLQIFLDRLIREMDDTRTGPVAGLNRNHPLLRFFAKEKPDDLGAYCALDDTVVWGALHTVAESAKAGTPSSLVHIAQRILERNVPACIDVARCFPMQSDKQISFKKEMDAQFESSLDKTIFFDSRSLSPYEGVGADVKKRYKRLLIQLPNGELREITEISDSVFANLNLKTVLERYYFLEGSEHEEAKQIVEKITRRGRTKRNIGRRKKPPTR